MEQFYIAVAGVLLTCVLSVALQRTSGEMAMLLGLGCCILVCMVAVHILRPAVAFIKRLQALGSLDSQMLMIVLKVTAVSFTTEIAGNVCSDSGNSALAKSLQILSTAVIVYLSLPMLQALLDLVERILGAI